jgi:hypothetical protein
MSDVYGLVVPTEIPWYLYLGQTLEELLHCLCDALGRQIFGQATSERPSAATTAA